MPVQVTLGQGADHAQSHPCEQLDNVSLGGLAFESPRAIRVGEEVSIRFPLLDDQQCLNGQVVWNREIDQGFEIGLQFDDPQALFACRMIEQICHIHHYRDQVEQQEGRKLTREQAASEWINRYAGDFPTFDNDK